MVAMLHELLSGGTPAQLDDAAREFIGYAVDGAKGMQLFIAGCLRTRGWDERRGNGNGHIREDVRGGVGEPADRD